MAKKYCDHNLVEVNHHPAKAGKGVRTGDKIILHFWNRTLTVKIINIPSKGIKAKEASTFYTIISEQQKEVPEEIF